MLDDGTRADRPPDRRSEGGHGGTPRPEDPPWSASRPAREDFDRPSSARVHDYLLGGAVNGAVDRELALELTAREPHVVDMARENRSFLRRAVDFLARAGVDQFLDLGSGIPSRGNVHEVARRVDPSARIAYVDVDPVAVGHGEALLASTPRTSTTLADLRDVDAVLTAPSVTRTLDLSRPVALCLFSVLQHVPDADDPAGVVRRYLDVLAPGSAVALSHVCDDDVRFDVPGLSRITGAYARGAMHPRTLRDIAPMLSGVDLVAPGLVWASLWRPDPAPRVRGVTCGHRAGVGFRGHAVHPAG